MATSERRRENEPEQRLVLLARVVVVMASLARGLSRRLSQPRTEDREALTAADATLPDTWKKIENAEGAYYWNTRTQVLSHNAPATLPHVLRSFSAVTASPSRVVVR